MTAITDLASLKARGRESLKLKLLFWFLFLALGVNIPFMNLYFKYLFAGNGGQTALAVIGFCVFMQPVSGIISGPVVGLIADKYKIGKRVLFFCAIVTCTGAILMCLPGIKGIIAWTEQAQVILISTGVVIIGIFVSPLLPTINTEALNFMHREGLDPRLYGTYRLFGSIGWIFITSVVGFLMFATGFITLPPLVFASGLLVFALVAVSGVQTRVEPVKIPWDYIKRDCKFRLFLIFAFLQSFGLTSALIFTAYFMDDLKANFFVIGLSFAISALLEIPIMSFSKRVIGRLGPYRMILLGTGILTLKVILLVSIVPLGNPILTFLAISIHGLGYALQFNGMVDLINNLAHKDLRATYMNVFNVVGFNIAGALGGAVSTFIISLSSSTWMMIINAGIAVLSMVYFAVFVREKQPASDAKKQGA